MHFLWRCPSCHHETSSSYCSPRLSQYQSSSSSNSDPSPWDYPGLPYPIHQSALLTLPSISILSLTASYHFCCCHCDLSHHGLPSGLFSVASHLDFLPSPPFSSFSLWAGRVTIPPFKEKSKTWTWFPLGSLTLSPPAQAHSPPAILLLLQHIKCLPQGLFTYCSLCLQCPSFRESCDFLSYFLGSLLKCDLTKRSQITTLCKMATTFYNLTFSHLAHLYFSSQCLSPWTH